MWVSKGLQGRIDRGLVDPATGEGFSGLIGFDVDGDGAADFATFIVGPNDEIPLQAQMNGATCKGIVNIGVWLEQCQPTGLSSSATEYRGPNPSGGRAPAGPILGYAGVALGNGDVAVLRYGRFDAALVAAWICLRRYLGRAQARASGSLGQSRRN